MDHFQCRLHVQLFCLEDVESERSSGASQRLSPPVCGTVLNPELSSERPGRATSGQGPHVMSLNRKSACGEAQPHVFGNPQVVDSVRPPSTNCTVQSSSFTGHPSNIVCSAPHTMSLLTPTESLAFQTFLDAAAFPVDWSMQLEISHEHMPPARGREALSKATKDLMLLDGDNWHFPPGPYSTSEHLATSAHKQQQVQTHPRSLLYSMRQKGSLDSNADEAEIAYSPAHSQSAQPPHHVINSTDSKRARGDPSSYHPSSSSSSSRQSPVDHLTSPSSARIPSLTKLSPLPDARSLNRRARAPTSRNLVDEAQLPAQNKAVLLSPSQKKANHIQSEQKRRANIRRGYDALCETVPALREACQVEDEQQLAEGKSKSRRRGKGRAKNDDGEKIDGRAGPRSENVVLSKTIDYLHELLSEREILMQRLQVARSTLPANHPLLQPRPDAPPLWERKWSGGEKGNDDDDDDDDD